MYMKPVVPGPEAACAGSRQVPAVSAGLGVDGLQPWVSISSLRVDLGATIPRVSKYPIFGVSG